jgi:hypothetical protein
MVEEPHLGAVDAWRVALEPGEVAAGVDIQEVRPRRVADGHGHVVQAARGRKKRPRTDTKKIKKKISLLDQSTRAMRTEMYRWDQGWQSVDRFSEPGIGSHGEKRKEGKGGRTRAGRRRRRAGRRRRTSPPAPSRSSPVCPLAPPEPGPARAAGPRAQPTSPRRPWAEQQVGRKG